MIANKVTILDYQQLYTIWSPLWTEQQKQEISLTFLQGKSFKIFDIDTKTIGGIL